LALCPTIISKKTLKKNGYLLYFLLTLAVFLMFSLGNYMVNMILGPTNSFSSTKKGPESDAVKEVPRTQLFIVENVLWNGFWVFNSICSPCGTEIKEQPQKPHFMSLLKNGFWVFTAHNH